MNYSYILSNSTYSYSRIKCFCQCKYAFLLKYVLGYEEEKNFFSEFGSLMHTCIEKFLSKELDKDEIIVYYMTEFSKQITHPALSHKIYENYFNSGLEYLKNLDFKYKDFAGIEKKVNFKVGDYDFVGFIDCVATDDTDLCIIDHKSKILKPRSHRQKPTVSDKELDDFLKQLYLYSIPMKEEFGRFPDKLEFNCFRDNSWISEDFDIKKYDETQKWALDTIEEIINETTWSPNCDYFYCKNLCGLHEECEYYDMI